MSRKKSQSVVPRSQHALRWSLISSVGMLLANTVAWAEEDGTTERHPASATKYTVTGKAGTGGTITPATQSINKDAKATLTVTPNAGYKVDEVEGCNGSLSDDGKTYTTGKITKACTVEASFSVVTFRVTATDNGSHDGSIWPSFRNVETGKTTTFTVDPDDGYVATVTGCDGSLSEDGKKYTTGEITKACAVEASFSKIPAIQYTVTATAGAGGTITPTTKKVNSGSTTTLAVKANSDGTVDSVTGCGGTLSRDKKTYTTGKITADCEVKATFKVPSYTVKATAGTGGTITPTTQSIPSGETATLTLKPDAGHMVKTVTGCGGKWAGSGTTYTTGPITKKCDVKATFTDAKYTVTVTANKGGVVTPAEPQLVDNGKKLTFTITPSAANVAIDTVEGCNGTLDRTVSTYTTGAITADCTVAVVFTTPLYKVTTKVLSGSGTITPTESKVAYGKTTAFTLAPASGYVTSAITGCAGTLKDNTYTTGPMVMDCAVEVTFVRSSYTVTFNKKTEGSGSISGSKVTVNRGATTSFTITPQSGYAITTITAQGCDGVLSGLPYDASGKRLTYTTGQITADCLIDVSLGKIGGSMVTIEKGCFQMGSAPFYDVNGNVILNASGNPAGEADRSDNERQHEVCFTKSFDFGKHEVAFREYDMFTMATGREKVVYDGPTDRAKRPVVNVSWEDAVAYTEWLSKVTGSTYRLPTEAEWEYVARAGTTTPFWTGNCVTVAQANFNGEGYDYDGPDFGTVCETETGKPATEKVGSYTANAFGVHDTIGNVWEWTCSAYDEQYAGGEKTCAAAGSEGERVFRGGAWETPAYWSRAAFRNHDDRNLKLPSIGFRVVSP